MILVLGGTAEGTRVTDCLTSRGVPVVLSVAGRAGAEFASEFQLLTGELTEETFMRTLDWGGYSAVVDVTHPYATKISELARRVCLSAGVDYLRYRRPATEIADEARVTWASGVEEAAESAFRPGRVVLLTTGTKDLAHFKTLADTAGCRLFARVLDHETSLDRCVEAGLSFEQVIAGVGPWSKEDNLEQITRWDIDVMVSKDGGAAGGTREKVEACQEAGIDLVIIERPNQTDQAFDTLEELVREAVERCR